MNCPKCKSKLQSENINIQSNIGKCDKCGNVFSISDSLNLKVDDGFNINKPPKGAWLQKDFNEIIIGATTRSPIAFFLVPFMVIWSGGSLGGLYGTQLSKGEFDLMQSLFGIPFLLGSVLFWGFALMSIWGKVEIRMDRQGGNIFTGIGQLGLSKTFKWKEVSSVKEAPSTVRYPGSNSGKLVLDGLNRISFGIGLNESRRYYLLSGLKSILLNIKSGKNFV